MISLYFTLAITYVVYVYKTSTHLSLVSKIACKVLSIKDHVLYYMLAQKVISGYLLIKFH